MTARSLELWRQPAFRAAVLNGGLILLVPSLWAAYLNYTWTAVRPFPPTVISSAVSAVPVLFVLAPVSLVVAWRTYVHARAFCVKPTTVWRGPVESAALGGGIALLIMIRATAATWGREPFHLVILYIAFYVAATAWAGLVLGLVLAGAALLAIRLQR
jgi:hypothetical protein